MIQTVDLCYNCRVCGAVSVPNSFPVILRLTTAAYRLNFPTGHDDVGSKRDVIRLLVIHFEDAAMLAWNLAGQP